MSVDLSRTRRKPAPAAELHRAWLALVDTDGPFLAIPPLKRVWPQGMPQLSYDANARLTDARHEFEAAWERHDRNRDDASRQAYETAREAWVDTVLRVVAGWKDSLVWDDETVLGAAAVTSPNRLVSARPTGALVRGEKVGAYVLVVDPVDSLHDPIDDGWAASPVDRLEAMLRAAEVPIGLVTDGRWWALVCARPDVMVASGIVDAFTWGEEAAARNAFFALLQRRHLLGGREDERLPALFEESVAAAEEITEALGAQVRRAVEQLVQAFSEQAVEARRRGRPGPLPDDPDLVYEAAVTVMMRVVFLLFAEERDLLPQDRLFEQGYGVGGSLDRLDERVRHESAEALDATSYAWHRLLATSRALSEGVTFDDIRMPAYGGSLFDAERFPFLTRLTDRGTLALTVSDRVMLEVLRSVQIAYLKGGEARRISFREIGVEQIGYIYEGLLGYTCVEIDDVRVGLVGTRGVEPEVTLAELEKFAEAAESPEGFADAVIAAVKESQPGSKPPTRAKLAKLYAGEVEDAERSLRAVVADEPLRERLLPFVGVIRRDLRDRPLVVQPGGLMVVETPSRRNAGAHYTPRSLAEEVVEHALEPLVYLPGPHQTVDRDDWRLRSSDDILELKVADIACGSGAFLVAAARYLAGRLVEAWHAEAVAQGSPHQLKTHAVRQVVATCLYGADINEMAVEMCKLSLWLVSLDRDLPFSFVDDKILCGNALLGLTDLDQLRALHIDPERAQQAGLYDLDVDGVISEAVRLRRRLASEVDDSDPARSAATKQRQWAEYQRVVADLIDIADGVVAAGLRLGGKPGKALNEAYENLRIAVADAYPTDGSAPDREMLDDIQRGLEPTVDTDYERWKPLHWPLAVPDVMEHGGFDAVVGNPPFLGGQKLTGAMGTNVRDWFVHVLAGGTRGSADLVAYFFLRAFDLSKRSGTLGLIATNTVAQGDSREIGLDRMADDDFTITHAIQSATWPSTSANLEYAAVWGTRGQVAPDVPRIADGVAVRRISTLLEPAGSVEGKPLRLKENAGIAFQGCIVLGKGFVLEPAEAQQWIDENPTNAEVLFPYLNGEDLNSRPDCSASRWVIDFNTRTEEEAAEYTLPFARVQQQVKPERLRNNRKIYREYWWQFGEKRPAMRAAIGDLDEVLVIALVSKTVMPMRVVTRQAFSHMLGVVATHSYGDQAVLSSSTHQMWAIKNGSGMRGDPRYTPSDVFETFPRPSVTDRLADIGKTLDTERREIMLRLKLGLTKLYNLVNDPDVTNDPDVSRLRDIHAEIDGAVMEAYGWSDVPLDHGFHTYRQMRRWTVSPAARVEILDRLLAENHRRAAEQ